jgi:hypothetical protein
MQFPTYAAILLLVALVTVCAGGPVLAQCYTVERLNEGRPIIDRDLFSEAGVARDGRNINGPSLIRVPDWLRPRLADTPAAEANYLLYFADHRGDYIRMAHAESITGPYTLYGVGPDVPKGQRGVLDLGPGNSIELGNGLRITNHIASPDVHVDDEHHRILMYFHAPARAGQGVDKIHGINQKTFVATSADGLDFRGEDDAAGILPVILGVAYFKVFEVGDRLYAVATRGSLYRARDPENPFSVPEEFNYGKELWEPWGSGHPSDNPFLKSIRAAKEAGDLPDSVRRPRHFAVHVVGDRIEFFHTRVGDAPERILVSAVDIDADGDSNVDSFRNWKPSFPPCEVLRPELEWEGATLDVKASAGSAGSGNQLRDPCIFQDADGTLYLLYSGAGEKAIGIARLEPTP